MISPSLIIDLKGFNPIELEDLQVYISTIKDSRGGSGFIHLEGMDDFNSHRTIPDPKYPYTLSYINFTLYEFMNFIRKLIPRIGKRYGLRIPIK
jgi:hypothetical protein